MKKLLVITLLLAFSQASFSSDTIKNGSDLLEFCKKSISIVGDENYAGLTEIDKSKGNMCTGYIMGINGYNHVLLLRDNNYYCPPADASDNLAITLVVKYLEDNTVRLHWRAHILAIMALKKAFPCKVAEKMK